MRAWPAISTDCSNVMFWSCPCSALVAGVKIEKGARIGAGSVVVGDVKKGQTVFGNPAVEISKK